MDEPKQPDSNTDWQNVEIFLFSNGQRQTPPRKYHLGSEDLSRWSSTLTSLAQIQYGSVFSSIDLYTVEGQRVRTPMEIINGAAYVAVPPRDTFIPAGYNDYLLRATRSREKRQKSFSDRNNTQVELLPGEFESKIEASEIEAKEEVEKVEILNEEINVATTSAIGNQTNMTPKVQPPYAKRKNQVEKLNSNSQNSTIIRPQSLVSNPQPMIRKTSMKLKDNPNKKNLKVNTVRGSNNSTLITNGNNQFKTNTKSVTKAVKSTDRETIKNSNERRKIEKQIEPQVSIIDTVRLSSTEKTVTTDNTALENIIDDNELIVVKKNDSELRSLMQSEYGSMYTTKPARLSSILPVLAPIKENKASSNNKEEATITVINNLIENVYKPETDVINDITSNTQTKLYTDSNVQEKQVEDVKFSKKPVDNFIAIIDNGEVVNLNLKIEMRKCEDVISSQDSKPINIITEKSSQVNIYQEIVETIAKRSNLTNKLTSDEDNPKVVVFRCSCCQNQNLNDILHKIDSEAVKLDGNKYVMLLPDPLVEKSVERNLSIREENRVIEKSTVNETRSSIFNPVKKVYATTSVQPLPTLKTTQDIGTTVTNFNDVNAQSKPEAVGSIYKSSMQKLYYADSEITTKSKNNTQKIIIDNSAQTEWCTILLEARRNEDGHYSFYLPPLHVLKYYGIN